MERREPTPTVAETIAVTAVGSSASPRLTSSTADEGRFVPGTLLGGRYRIIGLLGRGGMGEVYRGTDLMLGQPVALKFLPEEASQNPRLRERFHGEVRVARLVSHPNVCRVYDIGEVDGMPFISMEYVDGEDLASLLTRIGRLPADKALETARKLCAGLAAAHDREVIHRDLKPQNIMINKRGEVVIMDFGLAAIADQLTGVEARNGTPAYMSPEQIKGTNVTAKSDIYALGLVLYELFTGRRPFDVKSLRELMEAQEAIQLTNMTSIAADIDPAVEKVIRRCLDPDPAKRPASAIAVATQLPGGDPLAAALAAGETPSPDMVAAHGVTEGLARRYSVPCIVVVLATLIMAPAIMQRTRAYAHATLDLSPEVLARKSREVAESFGYTRRPADSAYWLEHRIDVINYLRRFPMPRKWDEWFTAESPIRLNYRDALDPLEAWPYGFVAADNPPPVRNGMVYALLDGDGRLMEFAAVPYADNQPLVPSVSPDAVFRAARLDQSRFHEAASSLLPARASDTVRAWKGPHPLFPSTELTVQVAWWKGRITQARVDAPWTAPASSTGQRTFLARLSEFSSIFGMGTMYLVAAIFAVRNWRLNRADRQGALRVAALRFVLSFLVWAGTAHPVANRDMIDMFENSVGGWLFNAATLWMLYLALEPAVRANWPHALVTWNRLLKGQWLDAQVGSHILIGAAVGCAIFGAIQLLALGFADPLNSGGGLGISLGARQWIGRHAQVFSGAFGLGLIFFFVVFCFRRMVRIDWVAAIIGAVIFALSEGEVVRSSEWQVAAIYIGFFTALIFVLLRVGLVATIVSICFLNSFINITLGSNWKTWYAPAGITTLVMLMAVALFAFWRSLGGRDLIGGES